ncbi:hypothetical protein ACEPPN_004850 [Leptodophora sp. 'Broadleaf-Isolate-01']
MSIRLQQTWKEQHGSRYTSGKFLLVRWESEDMGIADEFAEFAQALSLYNIDAEVFLIPDKSPQVALNVKVAQFRDQDNCPTVLKGFMYSGHETGNQYRTDSWWTPTIGSRYIVESGPVQEMLEQSVSDVLIIYDACQSADSARSEVVPGGVKELIAACCLSLLTSGVEDGSFTTYLTRILREEHALGLPLSISTLVSKVLSRKKTEWQRIAAGLNSPDQATGAAVRFHTAPVYCKLSTKSSDRGIILHPIQTSNMFTRSAKAICTKSPSNEISISFRTSALDTDSMKEWEEWIRTAPPSAAEFLNFKFTEAPSSSLKQIQDARDICSD